MLPVVRPLVSAFRAAATVPHGYTSKRLPSSGTSACDHPWFGGFVLVKFEDGASKIILSSNGLPWANIDCAASAANRQNCTFGSVIRIEEGEVKAFRITDIFFRENEPAPTVRDLGCAAIVWKPHD